MCLFSLTKHLSKRHRLLIDKGFQLKFAAAFSEENVHMYSEEKVPTCFVKFYRKRPLSVFYVVNLHVYFDFTSSDHISIWRVVPLFICKII